MVITFQIDKIKPDHYRIATCWGGAEVGIPAIYASIEEAIREEATEVPDGFAHFADVTYGGASSGTIALTELPKCAVQVAEKLVAIVAQMHRIAES